MRLSEREFERLVRDGVAMIPEEIRAFVDNVQLIIEEEPDAKLRAELGLEPDETLYGLYQGVPLTERDTEYLALPDRILIFRRPLLEDFDTPEELRFEVANTVIHEVAHHFGIDEDRLRDLGWQ